MAIPLYAGVLAMFFFYAGRTYTATAAGRLIKRVSCEQCRKDYCYPVVRVATGSGESPYMLDDKGASKRANDRASRALEKQLNEGVEPACCPRCGWMQADMVREMRKRARKAWGTGGTVGLVVAVIAAALAIAMGNEWRTASLVMYAVTLASAALCIAAYARVWMKWHDPDPNADWTGQWRPIPGSAMTLAISAVAQGQWKEEFSRPGEPLVRDGWVEVCLPALTMPSRCCGCLGPADEWLRVPAGQKPVDVPVCRGCAATCRRKFIVLALAGAAAGIASSFGVIVPLGLLSGEMWAPILCAILLSIPLAITGVIVAPKRWGVPCRTRCVDAQRGLFALHPANAEFRDLLIDAARGNTGEMEAEIASPDPSAALPGTMASAS